MRFELIPLKPQFNMQTFTLYLPTKPKLKKNWQGRTRTYINGS